MSSYKIWLHHARSLWLFHIILLGGLGLLGAVMFWMRLWMPLVVPLLSLVAIGLLLLFSSRLSWQRHLIDAQQCELDRLHTIEQDAVIAQVRKLIHRIAADIHDGPLQELKLVMDCLELMQMNLPEVDLNPILDRLEELGNHLRQQLNETRAITLEITPNLRGGLHLGITNKLKQLIDSGELTLTVIQHIQPLSEPPFNSLWLEAREDIYRFFTEAIANVIQHAQPPTGNATQVRVSLAQNDDQCVLSIENDGTILELSDLTMADQQHRRGGYGTKLMQAIATDLPNGKFTRIPLNTGGIRVELTWYLVAQIQ